MRVRGSIAAFVVLAGIVLWACSDPPEPVRTPESDAPPGPPSPWVVLEEGLELGEFQGRPPAGVGDSLIRVLRIDPARFELRLLNASASGQGKILTAREWCRQNDLVAAINSSMYQTDYRSSVSLMVTPGHTNNPRLSKDRAVLAFDPRDETVPEVQIIDRDCQDFEELRSRYGSLVQSIRMVSCTGENVWSPQDRRWSTSAIGMDDEGHVLFIHVRSPYSTHDLIKLLLELPIGLRNAMYAEGGPEAQLFVSGGGREFEYMGHFETLLVQNENLYVAMPIPNVIGVVRK